ncbi:hypothetical protein ACFOPN_12480 [Xanthomonas hyacinthi]|uniref:hypothetical protein n=1 Tax=Xanthomonas hyacinthi TaxID=56455 RepID=UPI000AF31046
MIHNTTHGGDLCPDTVRARRWHGDGDVLGYRPLRGWTARALPACRAVDHRDEGIPPIRASPRPFRLGLVVKNPGAAVAAPGVKAQSKITPLPPSIRRQRGDLKNHQSNRVPGGTDWSGTHNATSPCSLWKPVTTRT